MVYLNDHIEDINVSEALLKVSKQRVEYALRYRQVQDQRLSLAAVLLLAEGLKREYGIRELPEFIYRPHGKPELRGHSDIHFNMSHCKRAALCVIDNVPVGCDIECVPKELDMDVCRYCFNESEITDILGSDGPTLTFTILWTKKEAFLKLTGEGLTNDLPKLLFSPQVRDVTFQTHVASDKSYVYTICRWIDI